MCYKKIGNTLNPGRTGVNTRGPDLGDPSNPKTWKGPWVSVTNPTDIANIIKGINIRQYHQAHTTPFGSGSLSTQIGRNGFSPTATALIQGNLPATLSFDLLPETIRILQTLASANPKMDNSQKVAVTPQAFIDAYKLAWESTSSSPSGRHIGHYKAILDDHTLVSLHASMMSLPFQHGFTSDRWARVTDIMLEKEPGNARCHRLRILALFESDLNQAKRILIGRPVQQHLEDHNIINNMQYGSRAGKQCPSAVLSKVLQHDIICLTKTTAAFIENDAIGCYDRLMNNMVLLALRKYGVPDTVALCLGELWDRTIHLIKTIYGTSEITYTSTPEVPLYGPGQGSTCGP
jgi:hypothetical protein